MPILAAINFMPGLTYIQRRRPQFSSLLLLSSSLKKANVVLLSVLWTKINRLMILNNSFPQNFSCWILVLDGNGNLSWQRWLFGGFLYSPRNSFTVKPSSLSLVSGHLGESLLKLLVDRLELLLLGDQLVLKSVNLRRRSNVENPSKDMMTLYFKLLF